MNGGGPAVLSDGEGDSLFIGVSMNPPLALKKSQVGDCLTGCKPFEIGKETPVSRQNDICRQIVYFIEAVYIVPKRFHLVRPGFDVGCYVKKVLSLSYRLETDWENVRKWDTGYVLMTKTMVQTCS